MYGWLWRSLPGSAGARTFQLVAIAVAVLAVAWLWVFPWASDYLAVYSFSP